MCRRYMEISTKRLTYQFRWQTRPLQSKESIVATSSADSSKSKIWAFSMIRDFVTDLGIVILPRCTWNCIDTYIVKIHKHFSMFHYCLTPLMNGSISKGYSHTATHSTQMYPNTLILHSPGTSGGFEQESCYTSQPQLSLLDHPTVEDHQAWPMGDLESPVGCTQWLSQLLMYKIPPTSSGSNMGDTQSEKQWSAKFQPPTSAFFAVLHIPLAFLPN